MHQLSLVPIQIDIQVSEKKDGQLILYNVMEKQIDPFERVVSSRIYITNMQTHYKHLIAIKKSTQNWKKSTPTKTIFLSPSKKEKLKLERQLQIDHSNFMLFNRMASIIKREKPVQNHVKKSAPWKLRQTLSKIDEENLKFLDRLAQSKATISNKKMRQDRKKQMSVINSMSRFRTQAYHKSNDKQAHSFRLKLNQIDGSKMKQFNQIFNHFKLRIKKVSSLPSINEHHQLNPRPIYQPTIITNEFVSSQAYFSKQMKKIQERRQRALNEILIYEKGRKNQKQLCTVNNLHEQQEQIIILYRKNRKIDYLQYRVSILRKKKIYEIICEPIDSQEKTYSIQLPEYEGNQMLEQIDYCYDALINNLFIENSELKIRKQSLLNRQTNQNEFFHRLADPTKVFNPSHITELANQQQSSALYESPSCKSQND